MVLGAKGTPLISFFTQLINVELHRPTSPLTTVDMITQCCVLLQLPFHFSYSESTQSLLAEVSKCKATACVTTGGGSQWPTGLGQASAAVRVLGLRFRIPPGAWMPVSRECRVLSERSLFDRLIPLSEESCGVWCVIVWDLETREKSSPGLRWAVAPEKKNCNG